jgi:AraC-like DNA-binding protein
MRYREIAPPPRLADRVECFWTSQEPAGQLHRVLPDGCADILFTRTSGGRLTLEAVGPMTCYRDHQAAPGQFHFGVRFRPGMWHDVLGVQADRIVDAVLPLEDLWGSRARRLADPLAEAASAEQCVCLVESILPMPSNGPVERTLAFLERARGCAALDDLARHAGMSTRQFRRLCLEKTGLSPKLLARVLRFRHAVSRIEPAAGDATVALDCGYYDQAHLIRDFREFAGQPPGRLKRGFVPAFLP